MRASVVWLGARGLESGCFPTKSMELTVDNKAFFHQSDQLFRNTKLPWVLVIILPTKITEIFRSKRKNHEKNIVRKRSILDSVIGC